MLLIIVVNKMLKRISICAVVIVMLISCFACIFTKTVKDEINKAVKATLSIDGKIRNFDANDADFAIIKENVYAMLGSAKRDPNANEQLKTDCTDSAVEYNKTAFDIWFEFSIDRGEYKKLFFTIDLKDTQSVFVYTTATESYDDGKILLHYSCDSKAVVQMVNSYSN